MQLAANKTVTLKGLRLLSKKTLKTVAMEVSAFLKEERVRSHVSIIHIEKNGSDRHSVRDALAHVYNVPRSVIDNAVDSPR